MGFNLNLGETPRPGKARRPAKRSTPIRLILLLGASLGMAVVCDVLLSSGRYSSLIIGDAGAAMETTRHFLKLITH